MIFELIKAEIAYKKTHYLIGPVLGLAFALTHLYIANTMSTDLEAALPLFFSMLFLCPPAVAGFSLPATIRRTVDDENRTYLLMSLPVSTPMVAMSQTLPVLLATLIPGALGILAMVFAGVAEGPLNPKHLTIGLLIVTTYAMTAFFVTELFNLVSKWVRTAIFALPFSIFCGLAYMEINGIDASVGMLFDSVLEIIPPIYFLAGWTLAAFLGHILLYTRVRRDFSVPNLTV